MRVHVLQHVFFESPAGIVSWAEKKNADITTTNFFEPGWYLPGVDEVDLLVIMGGPMGVHDDSSYPWLEVEKNFIRDFVRGNGKVLGVCLGAQLLADALGARVTQNATKEIGWFPIYSTAPAHPLWADVPDTLRVFHWHGDTFDLPADAVWLARSDACKHQAFLWKERVLGLQFHIEMLPEHAEALIEHCGHELEETGETIQGAASIMEGFSHAAALPRVLELWLDRFTG